MPSTRKSTSIELQDRDVDLLRGLIDCRLMTLAHAAAHHFNGSREAAKKRIQKLKAASLIGERTRKVYEPSILFLTRAGFTLLKERGLLNNVPQLWWASLEKRLRVSDPTLRHELEVMDVKGAICSALRATPHFETAEFSTWPLLFQFEARPGTGEDVLVKPDAFVRIREQEAGDVFEHIFFLELDRSTETLDTLCRRALCYLDFYKRGGLAERFGRPRSEYKDFPFRLLMVFKMAERRNNVAERLLAGQPPIFTQVWFSTLEEVKANPVGPIWIRPTDDRDAISGAPYIASALEVARYYRRDAERERVVESSVSKLTLLAPKV